MAFDPNPAASALVARHRRSVVALDPGIAPQVGAEAIAVQVAVAQRVGAHPPAGFKIGATAPRMQAYLGLAGPIAGFMAETGLHGTGSTLAFSHFLNPGVECELAVVLDRDLPGSCSASEAATAVSGVMCGIEIVENRYGPNDRLDVGLLVADQVFHAGAVLGGPYPAWRDIDLVGLDGEILVDGKLRGAGRGGDLLGDPMAALAWLAGSAEVAGFGGLRAGQVVMLGSVTPPIWLDGPAAVEVSFPPLPPVILHLV